MRILRALACAGLAAAAGCGEREIARPARSPGIHPPPPSLAVLDRIRSRRLSVDVVQQPLGDLCRLIERLSGIRIRVEESPGLSAGARVSVALEDRPVAAILDWACRQADAFYVAEGPEIRIVRDLPASALSACTTLGYSLQPVSAPPGRPGISVELRTDRVWDPSREQVDAFLGRGKDREEDLRRRRSGERAVEEFLRIAREALEPVTARCPEARLTEIRGRMIATLPPRGHRRLEELLSAFRRDAPTPLPPGPFPAALPGSPRAVSIDTTDWGEAVRACARAWGLPIGYDARQALAWTPRRIRLSGDLEPEAALSDLLRQGAWAEYRLEPEGIWLSAVQEGVPPPFSSEHPWDRCQVRAYEIPERLLAKEGGSPVIERVRACLAPAPTRGQGRLLAVHIGASLLVAIEPPEVLAKIPAILEELTGKDPDEGSALRGGGDAGEEDR